MDPKDMIRFASVHGRAAWVMWVEATGRTPEWMARQIAAAWKASGHARVRLVDTNFPLFFDIRFDGETLWEMRLAALEPGAPQSHCDWFSRFASEAESGTCIVPGAFVTS